MAFGRLIVASCTSPAARVVIESGVLRIKESVAETLVRHHAQQPVAPCAELVDALRAARRNRRLPDQAAAG